MQFLTIHPAMCVGNIQTGDVIWIPASGCLERSDPMWTRKVQRDKKKGVDSPVPTQVVSNEEFIPRPQNDRQKQLEQLIGEMGTANARKIGMDRRAFMASSMGLATCFLATNKIYG